VAFDTPRVRVAIGAGAATASLDPAAMSMPGFPTVKRARTTDGGARLVPVEVAPIGFRRYRLAFRKPRVARSTARGPDDENLEGA
jgi:hypothetical protein